MHSPKLQRSPRSRPGPAFPTSASHRKRFGPASARDAVAGQSAPRGADGLGRARSTYVRRRAEDTVPHYVVREHLETFLTEARLRGVARGCRALSSASCASSCAAGCWRAASHGSGAPTVGVRFSWRFPARAAASAPRVDPPAEWNCETSVGTVRGDTVANYGVEAAQVIDEMSGGAARRRISKRRGVPEGSSLCLPPFVRVGVMGMSTTDPPRGRVDESPGEHLDPLAEGQVGGSSAPTGRAPRRRVQPGGAIADSAEAFGSCPPTRRAPEPREGRVVTVDDHRSRARASSAPSCRCDGRG